jgi:hypothetical protein
LSPHRNPSRPPTAPSAAVGETAPIGPQPGAVPARPVTPVRDTAGSPGAPDRAARTVTTGAPGSTATLAAAMDEDAVERHMRWIIADLRDLGANILAYHPWKTHAKRAAIGWPDWAVAGPGGVIFRELKREGRNPTKAQQEWLDYMVTAGLDAGVWRPSDVISGKMAAELTRISGLRREVAFSSTFNNPRHNFAGGAEGAT